MATTSMMSTMTNLIASTLSHLKARSTRVEFIHQPHIHWPHPLPTPHLSAGPGSITTIISDSGLLITVLKICPSTHQLLLTVLLPAFVHKAEILYVCCSSYWSAAHFHTRCQHAWVFSCTLILWQWLNYGHACYPVILFFLLMVTILEFFALSMLWGLWTLRGNLTSWSSTGEANQINIVDIDNELWTFSSSEVQSKVCLCKRQLLAPDGPQWNCSVYWRTQIVLTVEWSM